MILSPGKLLFLQVLFKHLQEQLNITEVGPPGSVSLKVVIFNA